MVLLICLGLIFGELNYNLQVKDNPINGDNIVFREFDTVSNDSLIPFETEWDPSVPDYLRQEY